MTLATENCERCEGTGWIDQAVGDSIISGISGRTCDCVEEQLKRIDLEEVAKRKAMKAATERPKIQTVQGRIAGVASRDPFELLEEALATDSSRPMIRSVLAELGEQKRQNYVSGSIRLALETARRKTDGGAGMAGVFRLDNRIAPALARMVLQLKPELRGWLEVRRMEGEEAEVAAAYGSKDAPLPIDQRLNWLDRERPMRPLPKGHGLRVLQAGSFPGVSCGMPQE